MQNLGWGVGGGVVGTLFIFGLLGIAYVMRKIKKGELRRAMANEGGRLNNAVDEVDNASIVAANNAAAIGPAANERLV